MAERGPNLRVDLAVLAFVLILFGGWLARHYLGLEFWYDEVYTLRHFVLVPWRTTLTDYHFPNNHLLFSLLLRLWTGLLGATGFADLVEAPERTRLLPLLFSLGAIVQVFRTARRFVGRGESWIAASVLAGSVPFLSFAVQLRGYSLGLWLTATALHHALAFRDNGRGRDAASAMIAASLSGHSPTCSSKAA